MVVTQSLAATQAAPGKASPKLQAAAKEFESVLLGQWLQDAESTFASVPGGDEDEDAGKQQMQGFATQQLAAGFTAQGGIGIAKLALKGLTDASNREHTGSAAASAAASHAVADAGNAAQAMAAYRTETVR